MGTNYYLYNWHGEEVGHLAKTSAGWVPGLQASEEYTTWEEFQEYISRHGYIIKDEYGNLWDAEDLIDKLERFREKNDRRHQRGYSDAGFDFVPGDWC